jgi:hypothetical protein
VGRAPLVVPGRPRHLNFRRHPENTGVMPQKNDDAPQLKDQEMYEALREEGASKEKAARISNAAARDGRSEVGERGGESGSYEDWTVEELKDRARELEITGYSDLRKDELIEKLRNH